MCEYPTLISFVTRLILHFAPPPVGYFPFLTKAAPFDMLHFEPRQGRPPQLSRFRFPLEDFSSFPVQLHLSLLLSLLIRDRVARSSLASTFFVLNFTHTSPHPSVRFSGSCFNKSLSILSCPFFCTWRMRHLRIFVDCPSLLRHFFLGKGRTLGAVSNLFPLIAAGELFCRPRPELA